MLKQQDNALLFSYDSETVRIEAWGDNALRIRATKCATFSKEDWALLCAAETKPLLKIGENGSIQNGKIRAEISRFGKISIYNQDNQLLLEEYSRNRKDVTDALCSALEVEAREFRPLTGGLYQITARFESLEQDEKIYGMGQYQQDSLDLKGMDLELAQRNSQASVPFAVSSRGYGLLWNHPGVGRAIFGKNKMSFEAYASDCLDYWIVAGDTPAEIVECYADVTGKVPMMPEYGLGFWQSKLRYQTQEELLSVAEEYHQRGIPLDVIVADFFHWNKQGDWSFDPVYWPDPEAMVQKLKEYGTELMVSVWPTVDRSCENYPEMLEKGYLIRVERGYRAGLDFEGVTIHIDTTNPQARAYLWEKIKKNYYDKGIRIFWLDEAEPEYSVYDFDNYRYHQGTNLQIGNQYPLQYARAFYEGMQSEGQRNIVNLLRCAWAGSQKYGALVWSGDIASSFLSMRNQLSAGLNMGMAGIPWWTTDIGGFHGGNPDNSEFRELFVRWFQWGTFCPVMRLHGDREPRQEQLGTTGGASCRSGAANEIWSYGEEVYEICRHYIELREKLRPYIRGLMQEAHEKGTPVMRTMFYEFPEDPECWKIEDTYLFGDQYLVAPILFEGQKTRKVYFPLNTKWIDIDTNEIYDGGQYVELKISFERIPVFQKTN